jgi:hypothetical protein
VSSFHDELRDLINRHSRENASDTPDFILATYLEACLRAFDAAVLVRDAWYGKEKSKEGVAIEL